MATIILAGFRGNMGTNVMRLIADNDDFDLIGVYDPHTTFDRTGALDYTDNLDVPIYHSLSSIDVTSDVWLDFSVPSAVFDNVHYALSQNIIPIVGTTGLDDAQLKSLQQVTQQNHMAGLIAPNFGLSAVLLMQFAKQAAKYFPDVEVIEMHHPGKLDAPSGTAINTAKLIAEARQSLPTINTNATESIEGARGGNVEDIHVHSVRLPGYVAHEQVLFGGKGEALTIRQDSFDRSSFMTGVAVAIRHRDRLNGLMVGLENVLD